MVSSGSDERGGARTRRPVIGLTTYLEQAAQGVWDVRAAFLPEVYFDAVTASGGIAVLLPPQPAPDDAAPAVLDGLDGLILTGGVDVQPLSTSTTAKARIMRATLRRAPLPQQSCAHRGHHLRVGAQREELHDGAAKRHRATQHQQRGGEANERVLPARQVPLTRPRRLGQRERPEVRERPAGATAREIAEQVQDWNWIASQQNRLASSQLQSQPIRILSLRS